METLSRGESELVALGAALGSNCVPCIEHHIPEARRAGLSDQQISEAIHVADRIRQVPARKVLDTALGLLTRLPSEPAAGSAAAPESVEPNEPAPVRALEKPDHGLAPAGSVNPGGYCCG